MDIGLIGAGSVGATLGRRWHEAGHAITFGVRRPQDDRYRELQSLGARVATVRAAASAAPIVVLATPWDASQQALKDAGSLRDKILIDCTNPLKPDLGGLTHGHDDSGAEQVARWAKDAKVVKAFNTVGFNIMQNPVLEGRKSAMYICGDSQQAKACVRQLSDQLGFETIDVGPLKSARLLEPLALLWISSAYKFGLGRDFAFSIIRRKAARDVRPEHGWLAYLPAETPWARMPTASLLRAILPPQRN